MADQVVVADERQKETARHFLSSCWDSGYGWHICGHAPHGEYCRKLPSWFVYVTFGCHLLASHRITWAYSIQAMTSLLGTRARYAHQFAWSASAQFLQPLASSFSLLFNIEILTTTNSMSHRYQHIEKGHCFVYLKSIVPSSAKPQAVACHYVFDSVFHRYDSGVLQFFWVQFLCPLSCLRPSRQSNWLSPKRVLFD
jgi:hypothetical protein